MVRKIHGCPRLGGKAYRPGDEEAFNQAVKAQKVTKANLTRLAKAGVIELEKAPAKPKASAKDD